MINPINIATKGYLKSPLDIAMKGFLLTIVQEVVKRSLKLTKVPDKYLVFPRFKLGKR